MNFIGIIPARYASSRFPGKPLAMIGGKPMIQRVYEQAKKALDYVVVATDDERIFDCVTSFGGLAVMTSADHPCGTNRCQEAYERCSLMVNALIDKGELPEELPNVKWNRRCATSTCPSMKAAPMPCAVCVIALKPTYPG